MQYSECCVLAGAVEIVLYWIVMNVAVVKVMFV
jgi:hypothetical protein